MTVASAPWRTLLLLPAVFQIVMHKCRLSDRKFTAGSPAAWLAIVLSMSFGNVALFAEDSIGYSQAIRPLLSANCFACHGPDEESREAGLRFDVREEAVDYGAIAPGDPNASLLIERIESSDPNLVMPPDDSGLTLNQSERELLRKWIAQGAVYEKHWSFVPPAKKKLPVAGDTKWPRSPIDKFVFARLDEAGLQPAPTATPQQLARRVALALTGLPPTPEMVARYTADPSDEAYAEMVEELLGSPAFGEHWAAMWLDLARYADTKGYEKDLPRSMWPYRDYVIRSLNDDKPFDQFTIEQIAGDLSASQENDPNRAIELKIASAMHRNTMANDEGGTDDEEFRVAAVKDRVDTTLQVWMGLTAGCAKCHSHKFDPISHNEYYRLFAVFNQSADADLSNDAPTLKMPTEEQTAEIARLEKMLAALPTPDASEDTAAPEATDPKDVAEPSERAKLEKLLAELRKSVVAVPIMERLNDEKLRESRIHLRGNFLEPGDVVEPGTPKAFTPDGTTAVVDRLKLAHWLVSQDNPLTARVMVNRVWSRLFGRGIVETEGDFGTQGTSPTHPDLLDWLAVEFRSTHHWSLKHLCRAIVLSSTFRQSSAIGAAKQQADPQNRLLSRGPRYRLSAEIVRDQALAAAGMLSPKMYGPSVMPRLPSGVMMLKSPYNSRKWETSPGEDAFRRGLYTFWKRTSPYPSMMVFDSESREVCTPRRIRTNTPLQALVLMNDPVYIEAAGGLARQMMIGTSAEPKDSIERGFSRLLARSPSAAEIEQLQELYHDAKLRFSQDTADAQDLLSAAGLSVDDGQMVEQAAWVTVASVLLNLDETIMLP